MKEISIAYNEDAKEWSNNKCKLYLICIIGYLLLLIERDHQFQFLFKLWLLIIDKTTTV
jgi:hypothetical protein